MRPWWLIVLVLPLGGCFADQQQQLASCKIDAMRLYPNPSPFPFTSYPIEEYVTTFMEMHGYKFSASPSACVAPSRSDPWCYVPTSPQLGQGVLGDQPDKRALAH
jgi:hypothetical protein